MLKILLRLYQKEQFKQQQQQEQQQQKLIKIAANKAKSAFDKPKDFELCYTC